MNFEHENEAHTRALIHKFIVTMKKHRELFTKMREKTGLGRSAHRMLMILSDTGGSISQTALAEKLEISTAAVAVMLKKMEAEGYITRKTDATDTRFNKISITEKGENVAKASKKDFFEIDTALLRGFSDEELSTLDGYLDRLQENIEGYEKGDAL